MKTLNVGVFGAALDTQNLGVSALGYGVFNALDSIAEVRSVVNFDYGKGASPVDSISGCSRITIERCGLYPTRRVYSPASVGRLNFEMKIGSSTTAAIRKVRSLDAILDISGGDSFSDIYGEKRFKNVFAAKQLAMSTGIPLILLPQTYGPFFNPHLMAQASKACQAAFACFSRDPVGYERLKELLGENFDSQRHISGVDMSFAMTPLPPSDEVTTVLSEVRKKAQGRHVVGLNVSGLVYSTSDGGKQAYGFKTNYREIIHALIDALVTKKNAYVVLVPHVLGSGLHDADPPSIPKVIAACSEKTRPWVSEIHTDKNPAMAKGLISKFDWFCGTRMHSTIAALSTATPVSTILYSDKAAGVFQAMGMDNHVVDPRKSDCSQVVERVLDSFDSRDNARKNLESIQSSMSTRAKQQLAPVLHRLADS